MTWSLPGRRRGVIRLRAWRLNSDTREWEALWSDSIITASDPDSAWWFIRHILSGSIYHIRDQQRAALTLDRFKAKLKEFGSRRPVSFGNVSDPKMAVVIDTPHL